MQQYASEFLAMRFSVLCHVRDEMADSQDKQRNKLVLKAADKLILMKLKKKS